MLPFGPAACHSLNSALRDPEPILHEEPQHMQPFRKSHEQRRSISISPTYLEVSEASSC